MDADFFDRTRSKRRAPKGMGMPHEGKPKTHPCMNQTRKDGDPASSARDTERPVRRALCRGLKDR